VILLPMAFLSGSFGSTNDYPRFLRAVGDVLPLKHFLDVVEHVYLDGRTIGSQVGAAAVVAGWCVAGVAVATRWFGWEPRER
jgi:ABC-2 type transport system permease protein